MTLLKNILLLFGSVLLAVAAVELFLVYVKPVYIHTISSENYQSSLNPIIAYEPKPLVKDHNSDGIRSTREYSRKKPEGVYRIVVAGDSIAYGHGVKTEETYAHLLEKMLNQRPDRPVRYEVINLGVPGYRISQVVERIKTRGLAYDPDLIVYGYWLDDIYYSANLHELTLLSAAYDGMEHSERLVLTDDIRSQTLRNFLLRFQISRRILLFYRSLKLTELNQDADSPDSANSDASIREALSDEIAPLLKEYRNEYRLGNLKDLKGFDPYYGFYADPENFLPWHRSLKEFADLTRRKNIDALLLMTPLIYEYDLDQYNWRPLHEFIRSVAAHYGIPCLDLLPEFSQYPPGEIGIGDTEHPNAAGHALIAEKLYAYLVARGI